MGEGAGSEDNSRIGRTVLVTKGRPKITVHDQNHGIRGDRESVFISQPLFPVQHNIRRLSWPMWLGDDGGWLTVLERANHRDDFARSETVIPIPVLVARRPGSELATNES